MTDRTRSFLTRLKSSAVIVLLLGLALWAGGLTLFLAVAAVSLIGLFEFYRTVGLWKTGLGLAGFLGGALFLEAVYLDWNAWLLLVLFLCLVLLLSTYVLTFPKYDVTQVAEAMFGILYVPVMLSHIYRISCLKGGSLLCILVFLASWGSDVFAYCSGMIFGKHKLTPVLSPKKTVEGAVGAVILTAALGAAFGAVFAAKLDVFRDPAVNVAVLCGLGSVISQIGDLAASAVKRNKGIKDYGNLIPGHGGILDRFDSVIITAPIVYYLIMILISLQQ